MKLSRECGWVGNREQGTIKDPSLLPGRTQESIKQKRGRGFWGKGLSMSKVNSFNWDPEKCCFSSPHLMLSIFLLNTSDLNMPPLFLSSEVVGGAGGRIFEARTESTDPPAVGQ